MAISQNKYINIIFTVGGSEIIRQRDLIARVFTTNYLVCRASCGVYRRINKRFGKRWRILWYYK